MTLASRGGQTGLVYTPTGKRILNKRCKEYYTHVVLTKHKNTGDDHGYFKWCKSLEEAQQVAKVDIWNREASWGYYDVIIAECQMVHPWELED